MHAHHQSFRRSARTCETPCEIFSAAAAAMHGFQRLRDEPAAESTATSESSIVYFREIASEQDYIIAPAPLPKSALRVGTTGTVGVANMPQAKARQTGTAETMAKETATAKAATTVRFASAAKTSTTRADHPMSTAAAPAPGAAAPSHPISTRPTRQRVAKGDSSHLLRRVRHVCCKAVLLPTNRCKETWDIWVLACTLHAALAVVRTSCIEPRPT